MVASATERLHGQTGAEEHAKEAAGEVNKTVDATAEAKDVLKNLNLTRGFQRMKLDLQGSERDVLNSMMMNMEKLVREEFAEEYAIMNDLHWEVREQVILDGEPQFDQWGYPEYVKNPDGSYAEDWSRLTQKQIKHFIFRIINATYAGEQKSANAWGRALLAKTRYEEAFAVQFDNHPNPKATNEVRKEHAESTAIDYKYYAVLQTWYSRKAEGIVKRLDILHQRMKDSLVS
jgi:hypothetical protein